MNWVSTALGEAAVKAQKKRLTGTERNEIFWKQKGKCFFCDEPMHKRPQYPDDGNSDPRWFTICIVSGEEPAVGACRKCNQTLQALIRQEEHISPAASKPQEEK